MRFNLLRVLAKGHISLGPIIALGEVAMAEGAQIDTLREVPASEILAKIEKSDPVEYDHVIIRGDIDISKLKLPKDNDMSIISSPVKITCSQFLGNVNLSDSIFTESVIFGESAFHGTATFEGSQFNGILPENRNQFVADANYNSSRSEEENGLIKSKFGGSINFNGVQFNDIANFYGCKFSGSAFFNLCQFNRDAIFIESKFDEYSFFRESKFGGNALFLRSKFKGSSISFYNSRFSRNAHFMGSKIGGPTSFSRSCFDRDAIFNFSQFNSRLGFEDCQFDGIVDFHEYKHKGEVLTFKEAKFKDPLSQEEACRRAKIILERGGNREDAGYHFYREMEARRMQKPWYLRYPEFVFIQLVFGYGVHPLRLWIWWFFFVGVFAAVYGIWNGVIGATRPLDYIWFSITVAVTPGFAGYKPIPGLFQVVAGLEAILGTFMWAAFIATFARKYMR
jgi:hypothetical protein